MKIISLNNNLKYNLLSLVNVLMGFIFIIILGRKFGASEFTDIYFISIVVISYLSIFIRMFWSAIKHYYIDYKLKRKIESDEVYNIIFNNIILYSCIIILLYFIVTDNFNLMSNEKKNFLDVFIFYILVRNLINFNTTILNLEHFFAAGYLTELIINIINVIVLIYYLDNIIIIAYSTLLASFLSLLYQMYLIYFKINIKYSFKFIRKDFYDVIYKNSFKLNVGGLFYLTKDLLTVSVLTSYGNGIYSIFSYANKFVGVILQVVNAPTFNIFVTKITYIISNEKYREINKLVKNIQSKLILLYLFSALVVYLILPYVLELLFTDKFTITDILTIQYIFILLIINYLIVTIEGPYLTTINLFKNFNYVLLVNFIFAVMMLLGFILFKYLELEYTGFFIFLILAQLSNGLLYFYKYKKILKKEIYE
jgi:putative peptidoglycan lipid II flippase